MSEADPLIRRDYKIKPSSLPRPLIIGVDPGLSGALAVICLDSMVILDLIDMPTFKTPSKSRKQGYLAHLDVHALSSLIDMYAPDTSMCVIEEPGSMPGQGLESTFRFGKMCGQIHGVLAGHNISVVPIRPSVWKSALGLSSDKRQSIDKAREYFPKQSGLWTLKKHNDRAEACLLTIYAMKYLKGVINLNRR